MKPLLACFILVATGAAQTVFSPNPNVIEVTTQCSGGDLWVCNLDQIYEGDTAQLHRGYSMSTTGDWTGDLKRDILAGATDPWDILAPADAFSSVAIYAGSALPVCPTTIAYLRVDVTPAEVGDRFGWAVTFVEDLDGDGRADFAVGAPRGPMAGAAATERGSVLVFLSSLMTQTSGVITTVHASLVILGDQVGDRFGYSMDRCGHFTTVPGAPSALPDLVVGAPGGASNAGSPGKVYIIPSESVLKAALDAAATPPLGPKIVTVSSLQGVIPVLGLQAGDRFGMSVAFAGDTAGDGTEDDIVVGAPQFAYDPLLDKTIYQAPGYARVLRGPSAAVAFTVYGELQSVLHQPGEPEILDAQFGLSVAGRVDLDNDGMHDVIVGAPQMDDQACGQASCSTENNGKVYAYAGGIGTLVKAHIGPGPGESFGNSVAGLGRINADNFDFFVVGSRKFGTHELNNQCVPCSPTDPNPGGRGCGRAYFFRRLENQPCFTISGEDPKDSAGWVVGTLGDLNGDGLHEIVVSAMRYESPLLSECGRIYVMLR